MTSIWPSAWFLFDRRQGSLTARICLDSVIEEQKFVVTRWDVLCRNCQKAVICVRMRNSGHWHAPASVTKLVQRLVGVDTSNGEGIGRLGLRKLTGWEIKKAMICVRMRDSESGLTYDLFDAFLPLLGVLAF